MKEKIRYVKMAMIVNKTYINEMYVKIARIQRPIKTGFYIQSSVWIHAGEY